MQGLKKATVHGSDVDGSPFRWGGGETPTCKLAPLVALQDNLSFQVGGPKQGCHPKTVRSEMLGPTACRSLQKIADAR